MTTPSPKTDRIAARFGGKDLTFSINRADLVRFEAAIEEPAQRRLDRIIGGFATISEIIEVIDYAGPPGYGRPIPSGAVDIMRVRLHRQGRIGGDQSFSARVLRENPPAKYAVLAQGILAAALHGLPEDAATFDENEADNDN